MGTQLSKFGTAGVLPFATQPPLVAVSGKRVARCNVSPLFMQVMCCFAFLQNKLS